MVKIHFKIVLKITDCSSGKVAIKYSSVCSMQSLSLCCDSGQKQSFQIFLQRQSRKDSGSKSLLREFLNLLCWMRTFSHTQSYSVTIKVNYFVTTIKAVTQINCMRICTLEDFKHHNNFRHGTCLNAMALEFGFIGTLNYKKLGIQSGEENCKSMQSRMACFTTCIYCVQLIVQIQVHSNNQQEEKEIIAFYNQTGSSSCPSPYLTGPTCFMVVVGYVQLSLCLFSSFLLGFVIGKNYT